MILDTLKFRHRGTYMEALLAGVCFAVAALLVSTPAVRLLGNTDKPHLIFASTASAFITGMLLWKIVFARARKPIRRRGMIVGALVGIVSHPLAWYLAYLWAAYVEGERFGLGSPIMVPFKALGISVGLAGISLVLVGWITAPVGAIVGGALDYVAGREGKDLPD